MSNVINLNKERKSRTKRDKRKRADENAAKFGRSKGDRSRDTKEATQLADKLDAHKRET